MITRPFHVSGNSLLPFSDSEESLQADPRGIVWMFEEPIPQAQYIMGCDASVGITGWSRATSTDGDHKIDNGAIEIFRVDAIKRLLTLKDGSPDIDPVTKLQKHIYRDLQVCEFAAPVDAVDIARVANVLGRIYAGNAEDQCELILESYPGPGMLTLQELMRLGYMNLWQWERIADGVAEQTPRIGWYSGRETQKILWYRSRRHLMERKAKVLSPWLLDEYRSAVIDMSKLRGVAGGGAHDDRMQAANMAFWAGHQWTYDPERTNEPVTLSPAIEPQRMAPVLGEYKSYRDAWVDAVEEWE